MGWALNPPDKVKVIGIPLETKLESCERGFSETKLRKGFAMAFLTTRELWRVRLVWQ